MSEQFVTRRQWLGTVALGGVGMSAADVFAADAPAAPASPPRSAEEALDRLQKGNKRFVEGRPRHVHSSKSYRSSLVDGQAPFAVIVGCSDSRVPIELIFDQGFGDLFVIRNAGNVIGHDVLGSIAYAVMHLHTKLVMILGHEGCGAVAATLKSQDERKAEPIELRTVLERIQPALDGVTLPTDPKQRLATAVDANVRWSVSELRRLRRERDVKLPFNIVGAVYDLDTGAVRILS